jgi:hypothetical protein
MFHLAPSSRYRKNMRNRLRAYCQQYEGSGETRTLSVNIANARSQLPLF